MCLWVWSEILVGGRGGLVWVGSVGGVVVGCYPRGENPMSSIGGSGVPRGLESRRVEDLSVSSPPSGLGFSRPEGQRSESETFDVVF